MKTICDESMKKCTVQFLTKHTAFEKLQLEVSYSFYSVMSFLSQLILIFIMKQYYFISLLYPVVTNKFSLPWLPYRMSQVIHRWWWLLIASVSYKIHLRLPLHLKWSWSVSVLVAAWSQMISNLFVIEKTFTEKLA